MLLTFCLYNFCNYVFLIHKNKKKNIYFTNMKICKIKKYYYHTFIYTMKNKLKYIIILEFSKRYTLARFFILFLMINYILEF